MSDIICRTEVLQLKNKYELIVQEESVNQNDFGIMRFASERMKIIKIFEVLFSILKISHIFKYNIHSSCYHVTR